MSETKKIKPNLITFDVYSALVDYSLGLKDIFSECSGLSSEKSIDLVRQWRFKQLQVLQISNSLNQKRMPFIQCTENSLDFICKVNDIKINENQKKHLIQAWDNLPLWPEAEEVITALIKKNYKIAVLSNGDHEMLQNLCNSYNFTFNHILSTDVNGYYKPHHSVYKLPENVLGIKSDNVLHVAGSEVDVIGCVSYGMPCYWSNRNDDILVYQNLSPIYTFKNLKGLVKILK